MIKNGIKIEEALVRRGVLRIHNEGSNNASSFNHHNNNEKSKFWTRKKNANDGAAETHNAKSVFNLSKTTTKTDQNTNQGTNQNVNTTIKIATIKVISCLNLHPIKHNQTTENSHLWVNHTNLH